MPFHIGQLVVVKGETGVIRFIGNTQFATGTWYGIELNTAIGKNDGSVNNVGYFKCSKPGNYGIFVRQTLIDISRKSSLSSDDGLSRAVTPRVSRNDSTNNLDSGKDRARASLSISSPDSVSKLHTIIERLQAKLKHATDDIKIYHQKLKELDQARSIDKERLYSLESQLERVSLDRDFLTDSYEQIHAKLEALQLQYDDLKYDYQILQEEVELNKQIELEVKEQLHESDSLDVQVILTRNKQLEVALVNLQAMIDSTELNMKLEIDELKLQLAANQNLQADYSAVSAKLASANKVIDSLQTQLESTLDSEKVIEHFTIENETLHAEVGRLTKTIDELNELHELDRSLEENQQVVEEQLRLDIKGLQDMIKSDKDTIESLKSKNKYMEKKMSLMKINVSPETPNTGSAIGDDLLLELKKCRATSIVDSIDRRLAESKLEILSEKLDLVRKTPKFNHIIQVISQLKLCQKYIGIIINNLDKLKLISCEYLKLQSYLTMLQTLCELNYSRDEFNKLFIDLVAKLGDYLLETIGKVKDSNLFSIDLQPIKIFIEELTSQLALFQGDYTGEDVAFSRFALELMIAELLAYAYTVHEIRTQLYDTQKEVELMNKFSKVSNMISEIENEIDRKLTVLRDHGPMLVAELDIRALMNNSNSSYRIISRVWDSSKSSEVLEVTNLLSDEAGLRLLHEIPDIINTYRTYSNYPLKSDKVYPTVYNTLGVEDEIEVAKTEVPVRDTELQGKYDVLAEQLAEKQQKIEDYELNISLLQSNMQNIDDQRLKQLSQLQKQFQETKASHDNDKVMIENLMKENEKLQAELKDMLKSNSIFDIKSFQDLDSENRNIEKLAIVEEMVALRKLALVNFDKGNIVKDDFAWLDKPLLDPLAFNVQEEVTAFKRSGRMIRDLAINTRLIKLQKHKTWQPRIHSPRYYNLQLEEQMSNYKAQQVQCFNK